MNANTCLRAQLGWIIAFIGSIVGDVQEIFPNITWWGAVYALVCIVGTTIVLGSGTSNTYGVAVSRPFTDRMLSTDCGHRLWDILQQDWPSLQLLLTTLFIRGMPQCKLLVLDISS